MSFHFYYSFMCVWFGIQWRTLLLFSRKHTLWYWKGKNRVCVNDYLHWFMTVTLTIWETYHFNFLRTYQTAQFMMLIWLSITARLCWLPTSVCQTDTWFVKDNFPPKAQLTNHNKGLLKKFLSDSFIEIFYYYGYKVESTCHSCLTFFNAWLRLYHTRDNRATTWRQSQK